jgi:hypothetical protein
MPSRIILVHSSSILSHVTLHLSSQNFRPLLHVYNLAMPSYISHGTQSLIWGRLEKIA